MTAETATADDFGQLAGTDYCLSDTVRVFGGWWCADPHPDRGLADRHAVTHDTVIDPDGSVTVEINGIPLEKLPERSGSWVR